MNISRRAVAILLVLICCATATGQSVWKESLGVLPSDCFLGLAVTIDVSGTIHVCGATGALTAETWYSNNATGQFSAPIVIAGTRHNDLAADSTGEVYFAGVEGQVPDCIAIASGEGGIQQSAAKIDSGCNAGSSSVTERSPSLAAGADGTLHLAYAIDGKIYYRKRVASSSWSAPVLLSGSIDSCATPSIGVDRSGGVHVAFSSSTSVNGRATIYYVGGNSSAFTPPVVLWNRAINLNGFVAPLVIDSHGNCHVVYAVNRGAPAVMHTERVNGVWSEPDTVMTINPQSENLSSVQLAISSGDIMHVVTSFWDNTLDSTALFQNAVHVSGRRHAWCRRRSILSSSHMRGFPDGGYPNGVLYGAHYMAVRDSIMAIVFRQWNGPSLNVVVLSTVLPTDPYLDDPPDTVDFGDVRVGLCHDTAFPLRSSGSPSGAILHLVSQLLPADGDSAFSLLSGGLIDIQDREEQPFRIRFCPADTGVFSTRLLLDDGYCSSPVVLLGRGLPPPHVWMDTAATRVGARTTIRCIITPALAAADGITAFRLEFAFDPDALYPRTVSPVTGTVRVEKNYSPEEGKLVVQGWADAGTTIQGNDLLAIEFEGLLTGQPVNRVHISEANFGEAVPAYTTGDGLVFLEGCEVGNAPAFGFRAKIHGVQSDAGGGTLRVRYSAPKGEEAILRVLNMLGQHERDLLLPPASGGEEESMISLAGISPGAHLLELVCGQTHTSLIVMVGP